MIQKYYPEIIGIFLCLSLGMFFGLSVDPDLMWYQTLQKPFFSPPSWFFGPVWTVLYIMIGIVGGIVWKQRQKNPTLMMLFIVQLSLNSIWSPLFFYYHALLIALIDIVILWVLLVTFLWLVVKDRTLFYLWLPYVVWVSFALLLNSAFYYLN